MAQSLISNPVHNPLQINSKGNLNWKLSKLKMAQKGKRAGSTTRCGLLNYYVSTSSPKSLSW
jgi:hypothetical protein